MKRLIGVGVGPGDPELVTVKAVRVLREADVVLVPVLAGSDPKALPTPEPGRAETIIRAYVDADKIKRVEFALNDTGGVTPRRAAAWRAAGTAVAAEFAGGASTVAFGTLGDPNLYSTFSYLAQTVRDLVPGVDVQTMVGISEQGKFKDPRDLVATFYNLTIGDSVLYLNALGKELSLRMAGNVTAWAPTHHWHDRSTFEKIFYLPVLNDCYGGTLDFVNNIGPRD